MTNGQWWFDLAVNLLTHAGALVVGFLFGMRGSPVRWLKEYYCFKKGYTQGMIDAHNAIRKAMEK